LVEDEEAGDATGATVVDTPRKRSPPVARAPSTTRLGHFQLLEPLGSGGMGTVYSAYDLRLDRKVAIKVLSKKSTGHEDEHQRQQRMLREAQVMAKLSHPNVVPVYEVGVDQDTVFIAMEYIAGQTLGDWRKDKQPSWREIVDVFIQAGRGLAAAHEVGIVHRDFKPANVLVDARGHVRVADFGVAQVRGMAMEDESARVPKFDLVGGDELTPPTPETPLTELGSLVGTPAYMSPEQFRSAAVDARSDQFSFCIALHEALFGKRPFQGRGKDLVNNVTNGVMDPPDPKAGVPSRLISIVLRGLSTDPDSRYPSMVELVDALSHDSGRRRKRIAVAAGGAAALAAVAMVVGWRLSAGHDEPACGGAESLLAGAWDERVHGAVAQSFGATHLPYAESSLAGITTALDEYRGTWIAMRTDACRATRVRGEQSEHLLDLRMACLDLRLGELRALTTLFADKADPKMVEKAVDAVAALTPIAACADTTALLKPGMEPDDPGARMRRAALRERFARLRASRLVGHSKGELAPARALVDDARAAHDPILLAQALDLHGALAMDAGELEAAEASLTEALRAARQIDDVDLLVTSTIDLVSTLAEGGISKSREALGVLRVAEAFVGDTHDPALPTRLALEKADEYLVLAHPELAQPILERAIEQARHTLGEDHILVFRLRTLLGSALGHGGDPAKALAGYEAVIANGTRVLGALHPATLMARLQRCSVFVDNGQLDQAATCFAPALADSRRVLPPDHRELLSFRENNAVALAGLGKIREAHDELVDILANVPASAWAEKWFIAADVAHVLGALEVDQGDYKAGLAHCEQGEAATEKQHAGPAGATCIAEALLGLDDPTRALAVLEPLRERIANTDPMRLGATPAMIGAWRFAYARALWAVRHEAAPARALAETARIELGESSKRAELDRWLAKLPAR
jgi:serine/threonine-protein kinase